MKNTKRKKVAAPIVVFAYNRPEKLDYCLNALKANNLAKQSELFLFVDGPKNGESPEHILKTRQVADLASGFSKVNRIYSCSNLGLASSIVKGVTHVLEIYDRAIIVEDDIIVSPNFLTYMNDSLDLYEDVDAVGSISGYSYPIDFEAPETFFVRGGECWGWATWSKKWLIFEPDGQILYDQLIALKIKRAFDCNNSFPYTRMLRQQIHGKIDSWAIRWHASLFLNGYFTLFPRRSLVRNIGFDESGTHGATTDIYNTNVTSTPVKIIKQMPKEDPKILAALARYYRRNRREAIVRKGLKILKGLSFDKL